MGATPQAVNQNSNQVLLEERSGSAVTLRLNRPAKLDVRVLVGDG